MLVEKASILCIKLHLLVEVWIKERMSRYCRVEGSFMAGNLDSISESLNAESKDHSWRCFLDPAVS